MFDINHAQLLDGSPVATFAMDPGFASKFPSPSQPC